MRRLAQIVLALELWAILGCASSELAKGVCLEQTVRLAQGADREGAFYQQTCLGPRP